VKKKIFSICLSVVVLVALIVVLAPGCTEDGADTYALTMTENPAAGGTATDETGGSPYEEGADVDIKAVPVGCYRFVSWSAPAGEFGNSTVAETTFTMPARDVTVTANFELTPPEPDHYKFYYTQEGAPYVGEEVELVDQFGTFNVTVGYAISFGNPVQKIHEGTTPIVDESRHYTLYELDYGEEMPMLDSWQVVVNNQFQDDEELTVWGPVALAVPTQKGGHEEPVCLDHLLVYDVIEGPYMEVVVNLDDQFIKEDVMVWEPIYFANPVQKTHDGVVTEIEKDDEHYVFYAIEDMWYESIEKTIQIDNQFGEETLDLTYRDTLAVPSQKISWEQPLDHFHCYWAEDVEGLPIEEVVELEDQFITDWLGEPLIAMVGESVHFANPTNKWHGEELAPISSWNDHYTFYKLYYEEMLPDWHVVVSNQFDPGEPQELYVSGYPEYLAVPTQKGDQDPPVNLDHFLVYEIHPEWVPPYVGADIWLWDQFTDYSTKLHEVAYFANPVKKTDATGVTDIMHPDDHLVWYWINGPSYFMIEDLPIDNQFGPQFLDVHPSEGDLLGVPSEKLFYEPLL